MPTETPHRGPGRKASRFGAGLPASLLCGETSYACEAVNISRSGCLLTGDLPEDPSGEAHVTIELPGKAADFECRVDIVRTDREDDGTLVVGLRFPTLAGERKQALELMISRVVEGLSPAPLEKLMTGASSQEVRAGLEKIPVPHRMALAARTGPRERALMMQDPNPQVLEALARNPGLQLHEAKLLARQRHLLPTTLELLCDGTSYRADEELKVILATHPRVTLTVAEKIVGTMNEQGVTKVLQRSGLPVEIKRRLADPALRRRLMGR